MRIQVVPGGDSHRFRSVVRSLLVGGHDVFPVAEGVEQKFRADVTISFVEGVFGESVPILLQTGDARKLFVFSSSSEIPDDFKGETAVVPFSVDTEAFKPSSQTKKDVVLAMGKLDPEKGFKTLVQAMAGVGGGFRAVIAGEESWYTTGDMQAYAACVGVESRVEFTGCVDDVRRLLGRAAVGVVPFLGNRFPSQVVMEFMASGVPVLVAATPGLCEMVVDGVTGLLHAPGNVRQLSAQIDHLLQNRGLAGFIAGNARAYCVENFSLRSVGKKWTAILEQVRSI